MEDATDRQEAETRLTGLVATRTAALADTEERFRAIFDAQYQFIWVLTPDGVLLEANQTALDAGGLTGEQAIGRPFAASPWLHPEDRPWAANAIKQAAQGIFVRREIMLRGAKGRNIWVDFSLKPVRDQASAKVRLIIPEGRDLTERRQLEAQLAQAQKTQALGQLAGGIAHDFNNILQSVSGAAAMLERRPSDHDRTTRLAKVIHDAAGRGASITQRLLSFARRGELRAEPIDADVLLANIREVLAHTLGSPVIVQAQVAPDAPPLMADRGQLETALVNLGTNARDAMPDGGILRLMACPDTVLEADHHQAGLQPGNYVRITVEDTGIGMEAAVLARVTEPFFTTKPEGRGTGLGLSMVKGFVEQSGGGLQIHSTPGQGTRMTLWLPRAAERAVLNPDDRAEPTVTPARSQRVLLVDDDGLVRDTIAEQLEELGFTVLVTGSGAAALTVLDNGDPIDAMVSELSMPEMNGIEAIQEARKRRPDLHCFLLTGYVGERAALASGDTFTLLRKPVSAAILSAQIRAKLSQSRQLDVQLANV
jgi:PAS domain S-box-containing protein